MRHRWIIPLLLVTASGVLQAQSADSAYVRRIKQDVDTISKDNGRPAYVKRAQARIKARADSILANKVDTVYRVDTVYVTKPPGNTLTIAIHSNGTSVKVGSSLQLAAEVKNADGTPSNVPVSWGVNAQGTISSTGLLTGKAVGTATVVAKADTFKTTRDYTVLAADTVVSPPDTVTPPPTDTISGPPAGGTLFVHPYPPLPNGALFAQFPRESVTVVVPPPTRTIVVQSLQAALDTAKTGDLLRIPANNTTTHLYLRASQPHQGWVTIAGTDATSVITQTVGGATSAINMESGSHHVRFLGPLTVRTNAPGTNAIIRSYNGETTLGAMVHDMILDSVTVDADTFEVRRCVWFDGVRMAVVRSKLLNCASRSGDAQAIIVGNGPGPYRFQSNWLEGGHQCIMSGGFDPAFKGNRPADAYVADNTCYKRPEWHYVDLGNGAKDYSGVKRQVKTVFEMKFGERWLFERNRCIGLWADAQAGFYLLLKSENQDGGNPTAQTQDITFRYNHCTSVANGWNIAAHPGSWPAVALNRVTLYDNLTDALSTNGNEGKPVQLLDAIQDVVLMNNTFRTSTLDAISFDGASGVRTSVLRNVIPNGTYGVKGSGNSTGTPSITAWITGQGGLFTNNLIVGCVVSMYPVGTTCALPVPVGVGADLTKVPQ
jgi:hypothetical protein